MLKLMSNQKSLHLLSVRKHATRYQRATTHLEVTQGRMPTTIHAPSGPTDLSDLLASVLPARHTRPTTRPPTQFLQLLLPV